MILLRALTRCGFFNVDQERGDEADNAYRNGHHEYLAPTGSFYDVAAHHGADDSSQGPGEVHHSEETCHVALTGTLSHHGHTGGCEEGHGYVEYHEER